MSFDNSEEFFSMNYSAEKQRLDGQSNGAIRILMGLAVGSMWFWSSPDGFTHDIYRFAFLISPLLGLTFIIWGIFMIRRSLKTPSLPAVEKLAYVLGAEGMRVLTIEPPAVLPWASLIDVTPLPKQSPMLRLLYRPVGAKLKQQLVINGDAHTRGGATLGERLPLWRTAMANQIATPR